MTHWVPAWLPPAIQHVAAARLMATGLFGVGGIATLWRRTQSIGWIVMAAAVIGLFGAGVVFRA